MVGLWTLVVCIFVRAGQTSRGDIQSWVPRTLYTELGSNTIGSTYTLLFCFVDFKLDVASSNTVTFGPGTLYDLLSGDGERDSCKLYPLELSLFSLFV